MTAPRVSIVIPAFNAASFIGAALDSATAQTLADHEVIVVDDASVDETAAIVGGRSAQDARIRLVRQPMNGGPSAARNRGFAEARGRWIALLDADDAYAPDRLERLVALGEEQAADFVADNLLLLPEGELQGARPMIPPVLLNQPRTLSLLEFLQRNVADPQFPGVNFGFLKPLMRADFVARNHLRYDERVRFAEDFALYLTALRAGARWWLTPEANYQYRVSKDGLTHVQTVHDLDVLRGKLAAVEASAGNDAALAGAAGRHRRVVDRLYHYRLFTDRIKAGRPGAAFQQFSESFEIATLISAECARQTPVIFRKLMGGGYFRRSRRLEPSAH